MNDKRDEVIEAALNHLTKRKMSLDTKYFSVSTEDMADFALSREAELRRQIADEFERIVWDYNSDLRHKTIGDACDQNGDECLVCEMCEKVAGVYEKLRGNK